MGREVFSVKNRRSRLVRIRQATWAGFAVVVLTGASARAQGFFDLFDPSPQRVEDKLQRSGYELRAPLVRHGDVYVGDVLAVNGAHERLVIDAHTMKIVAHYPARGRGAAPDWRDAGDDTDPWSGAPRPPRGIGPRPAQAFDDFGPVRRPGDPDVFARADPSAPAGGFFDDPAAGGGYLERPRPKPHPSKPKPTYVAPTAKSVGPAATAPAPTAAGLPAQAVVSTTPDASAAAPSETVKAAPAPARTEAPAAAPAVKPVAEAKPVADAPAPQPRPASKTKALNDLPVTPLD